MKNILLITYLLAVFLFSGYTKAHLAAVDHELPIQNVQFNKSTYALHIQGQLISQCDTNLRPLVFINSEKNIEIKIIADTRTSCGLQMNGHFDVVFDLRTQLNSFGVSPQQPIQVVFPEINYVLSFTQKTTLPSYTVGFESLTGELNFKSNEFYLISSDGEEININVAHIDNKKSLIKYVGQNVHVKGYPLNYSVYPNGFTEPHFNSQQTPSLLLNSISTSSLNSPVY